MKLITLALFSVTFCALHFIASVAPEEKADTHELKCYHCPFTPCAATEEHLHKCREMDLAVHAVSFFQAIFGKRNTDQSTTTQYACKGKKDEGKEEEKLIRSCVIDKGDIKMECVGEKRKQCFCNTDACNSGSSASLGLSASTSGSNSLFSPWSLTVLFVASFTIARFGSFQ